MAGARRKSGDGAWFAPKRKTGDGPWSALANRGRMAVEQLRDFAGLVAAGRRSRAGGVGGWADVPRRHMVRELSGLYAVACDFWEGLRTGTEEVSQLSAREVEDGISIFGGAWDTFLLTGNRR